MNLLRALLIMTLVVCPATTAWAQTPPPTPAAKTPKSDKTDLVTLANGDRITGEIMSLSRGRLEFKTDDAGTMQIEWDKIARIEAVLRQFDIVTTSGQRLFGSLGQASDRIVRVVSGNGSESFGFLDVTSITPIESSFWKTLDGSVDAGFSYTKSSGISQTTFNSATAFRRPSFLIKLAGSATVTTQNDGTGQDDRATMDLTYVRYRARNWLVYSGGTLETNESLGLKLRSQLGAGFGRRLVNTNRSQVLLGGGFVGNDERAVDASGAQNFEGAVTFNASFYTYDRPKTNIDFTGVYYPSLSNWGRQRVQVDTSLKRELFKDFFFSLDFFYTFDSAPPNPDAQRTDVGVVTSIGWSY